LKTAELTRYRETAGLTLCRKEITSKRHSGGYLQSPEEKKGSATFPSPVDEQPPSSLFRPGWLVRAIRPSLRIIECRDFLTELKGRTSPIFGISRLYPHRCSARSDIQRRLAGKGLTYTLQIKVIGCCNISISTPVFQTLKHHPYLPV
jgi:hypothetical protein